MSVFEREFECEYEVCKVTFGAKHKDDQAYAPLLKHNDRLRYRPSLPAGAIADQRINPKRMHREISKQPGDAPA